MPLYATSRTASQHQPLMLLQDLRNHGESPHDQRHDYTAMSEDVRDFIDRHDLKNPTLIGHSMYRPRPAYPSKC